MKPFTDTPTHQKPVKMNLAQKKRLIQLGSDVLLQESQALQAMSKALDETFADACATLHHALGRIVVLGIGKSGHIGRKIAATFASTGTPAFFVHASEACHGDLGMLKATDCVVALSYSGETHEVLRTLPHIQRLGVPVIALTGKNTSTLARAADCVLVVSVQKEACPLGIAPTTSSTAMLAMGDALAVALLDFRGFGSQDFASLHPGGSLGKSLLLRVDQLMVQGPRLPIVTPDTSIADTLIEMSRQALGVALVVENQQLLGIFTDGDLRRTLDLRSDLHSTSIAKVMTQSPHTTDPQTLASQALTRMQQHKIMHLVVLNPSQHVIGLLHIHRLIQEGLGS